LKPEEVPYAPAVQFKGEWDNVAAQLCEQYVKSGISHAADKVSVTALAEVEALKYEYKYLNRDQRTLLPKTAGKLDYHDAMVRAFLKAVGEDPDRVMASFKKPGMGALHRRHITWTSLLNGAVRALQGLLHLNVYGKIAVAVVQFVVNICIGSATYLSGKQRFRNSATEEILPLGRADTPPTAKAGPDLLRAVAGLRRLFGADRKLRKMQKALGRFNRAVAMDNVNSTPHTRNAVDNARTDLEIELAKFCYRAESTSRFKAASESSKVEWRGNERYLYTSYTQTAFNSVAGLMAILTPAVFATAVTGGIAAGVAAFSALLYLLYQISDAPSKDGEAKAKRAIVALAKSGDLLDSDVTATQRKYEQAYETYLDECKAARLKESPKRTTAREDARKKLAGTLDEIRMGDKGNPKFQPHKNWEDYTEYASKRAKLTEQVRREPWNIDEVMKKLAALEAEFGARYKGHFNVKATTDAWKTPLRMRFDGARKRVAGDFARSHRKLKRLDEQIRHAGHAKKEALRTLRMGMKQKLEDDLLDLLNMELALHHMERVISGSSGDSAATTNQTKKQAMDQAIKALRAVRNEHVHDLFCGDATTQVNELTQAKALAVGEQERYMYTNGGSAIAGIVADNVFAPAVTLANAAVNLDHVAHDLPPRDLKYTDQGIPGLFQRGPTASNSHYSAANRAHLQKTGLQWVQDATASKGKPIELPLPIPESGYVRSNDMQVAALLANLVALDSVPEAIVMNIQPTAPRSDANDKKLKVDLTKTTHYDKRQVDKAEPSQKRTRFWRNAAVVGNQALTSLIAMPAHLLATPMLKSSKDARSRGSGIQDAARSALQRQRPSFNEARAGQRPAAATPSGTQAKSAQAEFPPRRYRSTVAGQR
jgi:hypothetical protein